MNGPLETMGNFLQLNHSTLKGICYSVSAMRRNLKGTDACFCSWVDLELLAGSLQSAEATITELLRALGSLMKNVHVEPAANISRDECIEKILHCVAELCQAVIFQHDGIKDSRINSNRKHRA
ncbi:hypothetical protein AV530_005327 [Patagioenas fasciata monilis]|uniref:Uncharacterized protein n=1 Tax=Patagioenas fasciata monilis TaxID=372326 RepID=A0A1V4JKX6_PATFA|nr:hypothetical protein AV530_005327 [Patagioenas fasciata monilis]